MPASDQEQIVNSLKRRVYSGPVDGVTDEVLERVRAAWQNHGYFKVQVNGDTTTMNSGPSSQRITLSVHVDEGFQYRLGRITFKNARAIRDTKALRALFPVKDGEPFDRSKIAKGLENLQKAYSQMGYINLTSFPSTTFEEELKLIFLDVDLDEGKQFYLSGINIHGLDEHLAQSLSNDFLVKPGDIFNQGLFELSMKRLSVPDSSAFRSYEVQPDERSGTVAITITFKHCPTN